MACLWIHGSSNISRVEKDDLFQRLSLLPRVWLRNFGRRNRWSIGALIESRSLLFCAPAGTFPKDTSRSTDTACRWPGRKSFRRWRIRHELGFRTQLTPSNTVTRMNVYSKNAYFESFDEVIHFFVRESSRCRERDQFSTEHKNCTPTRIRFSDCFRFFGAYSENCRRHLIC